MAWIKVDDCILNHYETKDFARFYGCDIFKSVGILIAFRLWVLSNAIDGDLRTHPAQRIGAGLGMDPKESEKFHKSLIKAGVIHQKPFRHVARFWEENNDYLKARFRRNVEKLAQIERLWTRTGQVQDTDCTCTVQVQDTYRTSAVRAREVKKERSTEKEKDVRKEINTLRPTTPLEPASSAPNGSKKSEPENGEAPVSKAEVQEFLKTLVKQRPDPF